MADPRPAATAKSRPRARAAAAPVLPSAAPGGAAVKNGAATSVGRGRHGPGAGIARTTDARTPKAARSTASKSAPASSAPVNNVNNASSALNGAANQPAPGATPSTSPAIAKAASAQARPAGDVWDERVAGALRFLQRRLTGEYDVDEFGFDVELTEAVVYPVLRAIKDHYFRVETLGVAHLPEQGPALLVANHSGTVPVDALMLSIAVHDSTPLRRHLRLLGADLVFRLPLLSEIARKTGATLACHPDAERLLRRGEYVGVFPEGFKGIGKPYRDRYQLRRFGRGGFVAAALRTGTPIVPVAIVGAEEIYPIVGNIKPLAKIAGLPYLPVTPLFPWLGPLGMLPLPSKWLIEFGEPITAAAPATDADDPLAVFHLAEQVRETIQQMLHALLRRRPDPFA